MSTRLHADAELIDAAGGPAKVAKALNTMVKPTKPMTGNAVSMWRLRGVAPVWRPSFAQMCALHSVELPKGWLEPDAKQKGVGTIAVDQSETPSAFAASA